MLKTILTQLSAKSIIKPFFLVLNDKRKREREGWSSQRWFVDSLTLYPFLFPFPSYSAAFKGLGNKSTSRTWSHCKFATTKLINKCYLSHLEAWKEAMVYESSMVRWTPLALRWLKANFDVVVKNEEVFIVYSL